MGRHDPLVKWDSVLDKFHKARARGEREHFVCANAEVAEAGSGMVFEEARDLIKDLFHDGILTEVVVARLKL